jgi:hypothetical protein
MTLPASGAISLFDVNTELGNSTSAQIGMLCTSVRTLFGDASGAVAMFDGHGKSNPPSAIGQAFQGGYYAGQISTAGNGIANYYLVVGPLSSAQSALAWKTTGTATSGTSSVIDGPSNTTTMNNSCHPAAHFTKGLTIGGYSDWYMPAKNELEIQYYNLKPTTCGNSLNEIPLTTCYSGVNANAVPARSSPYTSGSPAQTSAAAFVTSTGAQAFASSFYWSSTEASSSGAWAQWFKNGGQYGSNTGKTNSYNVRAVRRVPV